MKPKTESLLYGIKCITGICLLCLCAPCLYAAHDTSLRTDLNYSYTFNNKYQSVSYVSVQANDDISTCNYIELGTGLQYQTMLKWLSFLAWYQQGYSKDNDDHWQLEQRPSLNLTLQASPYAFKTSDQIRYEYRVKPGWQDYRIKNSLTITLPDILLQPYAGWEIYYEHQNKTVMLHRIKCGIKRDMGKYTSGGIYYRVDFSNIDCRWGWTRQLVGFQITIK